MINTDKNTPITTFRAAFRLSLGAMFIAIGKTIGGKHWTILELYYLESWYERINHRFTMTPQPTTTDKGNKS